MNYYIICDSSCDLERDKLTEWGLCPERIELTTIYDGELIEVTDLDDFYRKVDDGTYTPDKLTTSSPTYTEVCRVLDYALAHTAPGTTIVYPHIATSLSSGADNMANMVFHEYEEMYPDYHFLTFGSHCISGGYGYYLRFLAKYQGDDILRDGLEIARHAEHLFTLRNFDFANRSGRFNIFKAAALKLASGLNISPWMYFPYDDVLQIGKKFFRGSNSILQAWVKTYLEQRVDDERGKIVHIAYASPTELKRAEKLTDYLLKADPDIDLSMHRIGPIIGSHTGGTCLAFFFYTKEREEH